MKIALPGFFKDASACTFALLGLVFVLTGCSTFDRDYEAALDQSVAADSPEGPWKGRWVSNKNGHKGELRCIVEKGIEETYTARFKARFWKCFTYTSTAELQMAEGDGERTFSGDAQLGWLAGGQYDYEGRVNQKFFFSEYENKWDYGTFYMERPKKEY